MSEKISAPKKRISIQTNFRVNFQFTGTSRPYRHASQHYNDYRFIMNYQDHLTNYVILKPLKSKRAEEIAYNLIDIYTLFGAPAILQSDNGKEFVNLVINELHIMWNEVKIVHGKPRHSQSQGSVERANRDVQEMLTAWMGDNNSSDWLSALRFIQFKKDRAFHSGTIKILIIVINS